MSLKTIKIVRDFRDDNQAFYKDEVRKVPAEKAGYYIGVGWAVDPESDAPPVEPDLSDKTLIVEKSSHDSKATNL